MAEEWGQRNDSLKISQLRTTSQVPFPCPYSHDISSSNCLAPRRVTLYLGRDRFASGGPEKKACILHIRPHQSSKYDLNPVPARLSYFSRLSPVSGRRIANEGRPRSRASPSTTRQRPARIALPRQLPSKVTVNIDRAGCSRHEGYGETEHGPTCLEHTFGVQRHAHPPENPQGA